jgi:hypothetical protein
MKASRIFTVAALLSILPAWAGATTITVTGQLHAFSYWDAGNYMNWFTGYSGVTAGDPYQLKLTFNDAAFVTPPKGGAAFSPAALTDIEFSIEGTVRMTISTDLKVQALNDVGGKDALHVFGEPLTSTVTGLDPAWWPGPRGYFGLDLYDPSQTAIEIGSPWDFARFFETGSVAISIGFKTGNPYSGYGPQMGAIIKSGSLAVPPPDTPAKVPDSGSAATAMLLGLGLIAAARRLV